MKRIFKIAVVLMLVFNVLNINVLDSIAQTASDNLSGSPDVIKIFGTYYSPLENEVDYITPQDGISVDEAQNLISDYFEAHDYNVKDDELDIEEITTNEFWDNTNAQIYVNHIETYAAVISDGTVNIISGMCIAAVYIADLNQDDKYEVCANVMCGWGWVDQRIIVVDVQNGKEYEMQDRFNTNYTLDIDTDTNELLVYENKVLGGKLVILDNDLAIIPVGENSDKTEDYIYTIDDMSVLSQSGEGLDYIPANQSFIVNVDITKNTER